MKKLPQAAVISWAFWVVSQGRDKLVRGPLTHRGRGWQLGGVNVDNSGIGHTKVLTARVGCRINLFGQVQPFATRFGQANQLFQPRGPSGLQMYTRIKLFECLVNRPVDRKLVAAGMNA